MTKELTISTDHLWAFSGSDLRIHDGERGGVTDSPDDSGGHEGGAHEPSDAVDGARQKQIPMEPGSLLEIPLWLGENELADVLLNEDEDEEEE